jgi:hypothetical protein
LESGVHWLWSSTEELSGELFDEPLLVVVDGPAGLDDELLVDADGGQGPVDGARVGSGTTRWSAREST